MKIEHKPINFEDARGSIRDIIVSTDINCATIISCKTGSVRGNHFHSHSDQYSYIVSGRFTCATKEMPDGPVEMREVVAGDLITNSANEAHAYKALEDSMFLQLSHGPRQGEDYENDTTRLETPILQ
jgi:quercetin dioxygenase-like cupin family protein